MKEYELKIPETVIFDRTGFVDTWVRAVRYCNAHGVEIVASSASLRPVMTKDINAVFVFTGNAIKQIEQKEVHDLYPFGEKAMNKYMETFTSTYLKWFRTLRDGDVRKSTYLYIDRLCDGIDQLSAMALNLRTEFISRRIQATTWNKKEDAFNPEPPCLQRIWVRQLSLDPLENGKYPVEYHVHWRSRDLFKAFPSNKIGLFAMLERYVFKGEYEVVKIVDTSDSTHIYEEDWEAAKKIRPLSVKL